MSLNPTKKEEPGRAKRVPGTLTTVAIVLVCMSAYFLIDRIAGGLYDSLPDGLQKFLIGVGLLLIAFIWLGRVFDRKAQDLQRIRQKERAAKERDLNSQTGQAHNPENDGNKL